MSSILITRSCKTAYGGFFHILEISLCTCNTLLFYQQKDLKKVKSLLTIDILRRAGIARVSFIKDREINGCDGISAIAL